MGVIYYEMWQFAAMCLIRILKIIFIINLNFKDYAVALHTATKCPKLETYWKKLY